MTGRRAGAALLVAVALAAMPAHAQEEGDRATLARLEQRSRNFYGMVERGERGQASNVWPSLADDLGAFASRLRERLDKQKEDVLERDGDLEALFRDPRWRDPEIMSLVATYHLAWVRYQGAQLTSDAGKKKALLRQAVSSFSQFLLVNEVPEIYSESLYGRGLAFMDLGETGKAVEDLSAAASDARIGGKAKAALAEARRRGGGGKAEQPAADDPEALFTRLDGLLPRAADDAAAEKDATALARGLAARGGTWPTRVAGAVDKAIGRSSYGIFLLAQLAVDRGRCADVPRIVATGADVKDAGRARLRPEAMFLAGGCLLNGGNPRDAAETFGTLGREFPDAARAREAAYYRVRALAVARIDDAARTPAYEEAIGAYLTRWPKTDDAGEVRWLSAELHRAAGDCARATQEYATVTTGAFATRVRLGALECRVAGLPRDDKDDAAGRQRRETVDALRAFVRDTPARGDDLPRVARATLLAAVVAAGASPPDHETVATVLDGYEQRFPDAKELIARAVPLRLGARVARKDYAAADKDLTAYLAAGGDAADRRRMLGRLGRDLATDVERAPEAERAVPLALARKVYQALIADGGDARDRVALADLSLRAGDAATARTLYEEALAADPTSTEALRGAARAAAAAGDKPAALARWRAVLEASPVGGTSWYEARLAQVALLSSSGDTATACQLVRSSRGRATSAGADQLEARLRAMEPEVCR